MSNLSALKGNHFVIVGRAGMDIYPDPPGTKTAEATSFFPCLGGSSANIGVAICKQGGKAAIVTSVSDDAVGQFVLNALDHYGIDRTQVKTVGGEVRTSLAVVESRVEDHQSVIYRNDAADFQMTLDDVEAIDYSNYSALITTGTVFACEPSRSAGLRAINLAREAGLPIILDIDYRPYSWASAQEAEDVYSKVASLCDIIVGNDDEFGVMAGDKAKGLNKARQLAHSSAQIVVYKMGEAGSITITAEDEFKTGIYRVKALKPTGAGDGFMGGFVNALVAGNELKEAVKRGSACAAMVVSKVGCAPAMPSTNELDDFLNSHPGLTQT